jgi:cyclomaltodextrinase / maltogenic alpha-amylase / neopullulanase
MMNREAILHIPISNYAHGIDEKHVLFRLRAAKDDLKSCRLFYGDRACRVTPVIFSSIPMKIVAQDELFDYYEVILESPYTRICYYFELDDEEETVLYYSDLFHQATVNDRSDYYQFPFNRREDIADIPEWTKDAVIYNIFPDSFATSYRYVSKIGEEKEHNGIITRGKLGGTIRGITENVDYIKKLGFNCIYINPFFAAGEYHKYDLIDYFHVDPCFGTDEEFKIMVKAYHENGIRVIIDGVFNHCGWNFFAFLDVVEHGENSRYKDWFYRLSFPVIKPDNMEDIPNYECFGYERLMPKMNTSNPEVIEYFCRVCSHWLREFDVDGWRLDVASEVNDDFWREFRKTAKRVKPDCFLIGEVWETAQHWLLGDQFDSSMNYDFRKNCKEFFALHSMDATSFDARVTLMRMRYHKNMLYGQLNLLDSHDVSRFLTLCNGELTKFKLAILFQMCFIGPPSVFYGDEQQIAGLLEDEYRSPMRWDEKNEMFDFYQKAIALRKEQKALRRGDYRTIDAQKGSSLYVFERFTDEECLFIALNAGPEEAALSTPFKTMEILLQFGLNETGLAGYGYVIAKKRHLDYNN